MKPATFKEDIHFGDKIATKVILESAFSKEIRIVLPAGGVMKEHESKFPIVVHVLEGEISFGVNKGIHRLEEGAIIALEGNTPHDLTAIENSVVRLTLSKFDSAERVESVAKE